MQMSVSICKNSSGKQYLTIGKKRCIQEELAIDLTLWSHGTRFSVMNY